MGLGEPPRTEVAGAPSPERIYLTPENAGDENVRRHIARYEFAARFIPAGATVLDCACGSGYGTEILAKSAGAVLGVDCSGEASEYACAHHGGPKVEFWHARMEMLHAEPKSLDAVVSLETLEHVPHEVCRTFLERAGCWIKPGGVLVASSPMLRYRDGKPYVTSPYHVNEMPKAELLKMFEDCLPGYLLHFYHQEQEAFLPLLGEDTGFCILVARRRSR